MFRSAGAYFSNSGSTIYSGAAGFNDKGKSMYRDSSLVGPLRTYKDGSLGGPVVGMRRAFKDGSLGGPVVGMRRAFKDGSLGGPVVGMRRAFKDGSLGGCSSCQGTGEYFAANGTGEYFAANGTGEYFAANGTGEYFATNGFAWWDGLTETQKRNYMIGGGVLAALGAVLLLRRKRR
jgi:LPXTG-motif cell wall-anchored protein